jgi:hypothetical protein
MSWQVAVRSDLFGVFSESRPLPWFKRAHSIGVHFPAYPHDRNRLQDQIRRALHAGGYTGERACDPMIQ